MPISPPQAQPLPAGSRRRTAQRQASLLAHVLRVVLQDVEGPAAAQLLFAA
jgi:hypothetical protein